jgi:hypothetical protein
MIVILTLSAMKGLFFLSSSTKMGAPSFRANERFTGILRLTHLGFFSVGCLSRQPREEAQTHDFSLYEKMF